MSNLSNFGSKVSAIARGAGQAVKNWMYVNKMNKATNAVNKNTTTMRNQLVRQNLVKRGINPDSEIASTAGKPIDKMLKNSNFQQVRNDTNRISEYLRPKSQEEQQNTIKKAFKK